MSNILIDKTVVQDLILGDKGSEYWWTPCRVVQDSQHTFQGGPNGCNKAFFDFERFETRTKKFVHFLSDGVSASVLLGEECQLKPRAHKPKRKGEREMKHLLCLCQAMRQRWTIWMQKIRKCWQRWAPRSITMRASSIGKTASRRSVMQYVHGGNKWSMGINTHGGRKK
jgi:hypothetical protein